jgi:hypothetical protein
VLAHRAHDAVWAIYGANKGDGEAAAKGETQQAKNAIQACVDAGIGHIVYSTLDGGLGAKHWDSKQAGEWGVSVWRRVGVAGHEVAAFLPCRLPLLLSSIPPLLFSSSPLLILFQFLPPFLLAFIRSSLIAVSFSNIHLDLCPPYS